MPNLLRNLIRKDIKLGSHGLVELSEAETAKVSGGSSSNTHINNVRIANNIINSPGVFSIFSTIPT